MESQEFKGRWFSPNNPDVRVPGMADFDSDGGELNLFGALIGDDTETDIFNLELEELFGGLLLGNTLDSGLVTISDANPTNVTGPLSPVETSTTSSTYEFTRIYKGAHFEQEPSFSQLSLSFDGLTEWFGESRVEPEFPDEEEVRSRYAIMEPKEVEIELPKAVLTIIADTAFSMSSTVTELEDSVIAHIDPDEPLSFLELREQYINPLQRYLALATTTPVHAKNITATADEDTRVEVLSMIPNHSPKERSVSPASMLFTPTDVDLESSIQHWFQNEAEAEFLFNFYFGTLYNSHLFLEHEFLSLAVAIESYFSHRNPDFKIMDQDAYREHIEAALNEIPDDLEIKQRLRGLLLSIGNLPSFKDKLEIVVDEERAVLSTLFDIEETLSMATTIRHDLAHGLGEDYSNRELANIRFRLQIIVECILLDIAGLGTDHKLQALYSKYHGASFLEVDTDTS